MGLGTNRLVVPGLTGPKSLLCSPRNTGNINFSLWLAGGLSQGCPDFQKLYVFKVYVPFSCPTHSLPQTLSAWLLFNLKERKEGGQRRTAPKTVYANSFYWGG